MSSRMQLSWTFLGPDGAFDLGDIDLPMGDIDLSGDWDCRDWLKESVDWWGKEIVSFAKEWPVTA